MDDSDLSTKWLLPTNKSEKKVWCKPETENRLNFYSGGEPSRFLGYTTAGWVNGESASSTQTIGNC